MKNTIKAIAAATVITISSSASAGFDCYWNDGTDSAYLTGVFSQLQKLRVEQTMRKMAGMSHADVDSSIYATYPNGQIFEAWKDEEKEKVWQVATNEKKLGQPSGAETFWYGYCEFDK